MSRIDSPKIRGPLALSIFVIRFGLTIYLAFILSVEVFEDIFSQVSLMSALFIFVSAANVNIKNFLLQRQGNFSLEDGVSYVRAFELVIALLFFVFSMLLQFHVIAVMIVLIRFSAVMKELEAELVNRRYALRYQLFGEAFLFFFIFLSFEMSSIWLLVPLFLLGNSLIFFIGGRSYQKAVNLFKSKGLKREGMLLEFNGMMIYGLDLFIMSLFRIIFFFH